MYVDYLNKLLPQVRPGGLIVAHSMTLRMDTYLARRLFLWVLFLLVLPVAALWLWVAQPSFASGDRSKVSADPAALRRHVAALSQEFHPRSYYDTGNLARCASYIEGRFRETGLTVTNQTYTAFNTPCRNVIAVIPGRDPRRVVIGAHYDAVPGSPGADDNASGVAGLLELARLLRGVTPERTVELVAYCTEEPPCFETEHMGSAHHARRLAENGTAVEAMLALEMIGTFSDEPGSQNFPVPLLRLFYPGRGCFIGVVGGTRCRRLTRTVKRAMRGATELPVYSIAAPDAVPGVDLSDHRSYWEAGFPAVMITDTAFYRNRHYHRPEDIADRLDYGRMAQVVVGVYEAVRALAGDGDRNNAAHGGPRSPSADANER